MRTTSLIPGILLVLNILMVRTFPQAKFEHPDRYKTNAWSPNDDQTEAKICKLNQIPFGGLPSGIDCITDQCWQIYLPEQNRSQSTSLRFNYSGICGCDDEVQLVLLKRTSRKFDWQILAENITFDYGEDLYDGIGSIEAREVALDSMTQFAIARKSIHWLPNIPRNITAYVIYGPVILQWETACEIDNKGYIIERKTVGTNWTKVGSIDALSLSVFAQLYRFEDLSRIGLNTKLSYRIKGFDQHGKITISPPIQIDYAPNPTCSKLTSVLLRSHEKSLDITYRTHFRGKAVLEVYQNSGQLLHTLMNKIHDKGSYSVVWNFDESKIDPERFSNGYCKLILKSQAGSRSFIHIQDITLQ